MKIAFSTIACPLWTLDEVVNTASKLGYLGVEMRSFHDQSVDLESDPYEIKAYSIKGIFKEAGIVPLTLATSVRFDKAINPPVIGRIFLNEEAGVSDAKVYVDLADQSGTRFVRVFGCDLPAAEPVSWSMTRVVNRLRLAAQTARNTDVRMLIENAGSFARAQDLLGLVNEVRSPLLDISYNTIAAVNIGGCPIEDVKVLKDHIKIIKICDVDSDGNAVKLGEGVLPLEKFIATLNEIEYDGWIVYEYPKLWDNSLSDDTEAVLKHAADTLYTWMNANAVNC
jgi:sugar phosphate isomerase/epimerase